MKKSLITILATTAILITGCGSEAEAEPEMEEAATQQTESTQDLSLFSNDINSVALMYRWVPAEGETTTQVLDGRYTYDVRRPGDDEGPADTFMSAITPGFDPKFPPETTFDFHIDYVPVPDGRRVYTAAHLYADNPPEGAGVECMIVSLDGEGILDHNLSHDPIKGAVCEYEF